MNKVTYNDILMAVKTFTFTPLPDGRTTICQGELYNGFTVMGKSSVVSKENFNAEAGKKFALEDMYDNCWEPLGAILAERLWQEKQNG